MMLTLRRVWGGVGNLSVAVVLGYSVILSMTFARPSAATNVLATSRADTMGADVGAPGAQTETPGTPLSSPLALIVDLERSWARADVDGVLACLSLAELELTLERCGGPTGRFARAQAEFLIRDLLHYGETLSFRIVEFEWKEDAPQARAEWQHRMASGEKSAELEMALAREGGAWRVVRIAAR